ncbi:MAG: DUF87 domain-containing protein [Vampirovibrionales bacterium]|nr:DUF87 domain-containing protein [Vampirovibrionales bacterium]
MFEFLKQKVSLPGSGGGGQGKLPRVLKVAPMFGVPLDDYKATGERDAILASSGMGKSYLTGVLMEETLETGSLLCVIDPEGEHFTLAERYPMLIVGGEHANLPLEEAAIDLYIDAMLKSGVSAVFDLSDHVDEEQQHLYGLIADALFTAEQKYRRKVRIVIEEAQIYAPQKTGGIASAKKGKDAKMDPLLASQKLAKRGRKRAIDSLWATQRPASISKDILSQCNRFWFGGITAELDYKAIRPFLNEAGISFPEIRSLQPGEFFFYSKGLTKKIKVRKRHCRHAGATPEAGQTFSATKNESMDKALSGLSAAIKARAEERVHEDSEIEQLKKFIKTLKGENEKLKKELEQERLATKVIERIHGVTPEGLGEVASGSGRPRRRTTRREDLTLALIADKVNEADQRLHPSHIRLDG